MSDFGLLQLLADVHQLGAALGPEGQLLQRPAGRALLRRLLVAEQLLDLVRPVDHHHCRRDKDFDFYQNHLKKTTHTSNNYFAIQLFVWSQATCGGRIWFDGAWA